MSVANGRVLLRTDGASRGNPGPAAIGYVLVDDSGQELAAEGRYIGRTTNNEAEYRALIAGLERAGALGVRILDVRLDSELIVLQLKGRYRVRTPHLLPLYERVRQLIAGFERVDVQHVRRLENSRADELANQALDQAKRRSPGTTSR